MATTAPRSTTKGRKPPQSAVKNASRRTVVDTNLLSYDRTDPFFAINALRKLLGSLVSRVGSCQYKLTTDEHKLSLHLLTIVEPFVGLSPSRRTLTRQPTEILDAIAFHVDSKRDLLALALSCHRMHGVIFPRHYDYRVICAKVSSVRVWNHLIVNRSLARNVRAIEIIDERSSKPLAVPSDIMTTDTDLESSDDELTMHSKQERHVVSALTKMTALRSFNWSCNHSPLSIDSIWATLLKCQSISEVIISDNLIFGPYTPDPIKPVTPKSVPLPDLKTVSLQSTKHVFGSTKTPELARISGMLTGCPNLESLDIEYEHRRGQGQQLPAADDFFLCSRWPGLRSLSLTNLRCSSAHSLESASVFLGAHANLEVLHLDLPVDRSATGGGLQLHLLPNSLPKLRELRCGRAIATAILNCPTDSPRPLEIIKGVKLSGSTWDHSFLSSLKVGGGTVKRFELAGWSDMEDIRRLVDCVPKLHWLDVSKRATEVQPHHSNRRSEGSGKVATPATVATNVTEWATVLAPLSELSTFNGIKFFYEVSSLTLATLATSSPTSLSPSELSRVRKNEKVANVLGNKCPKLRRLDHWEDAGGRVIVLSRDGNEIKWEVRRFRTSEEGETKFRSKYHLH
ncbi:hypothetical protein HYDPIDRAFT_90053 [Hydnomerulius pinastri MD-312]|uniref:F-box domain-containing protein n=1 Tax=Hydnomerulius pinastri MD-312 TaxID=994086 RepID=A0A0C9W9V8_9AGAM|nr:hypothetical protein HYDPIDRAFT_90053 [Hydnomerulius pinastri MD-312]